MVSGVDVHLARTRRAVSQLRGGMGTSELHFGMHSTGIPPLAGLDLFLGLKAHTRSFSIIHLPVRHFMVLLQCSGSPLVHLHRAWPFLATALGLALVGARSIEHALRRCCCHLCIRRLSDRKTQDIVHDVSIPTIAPAVLVLCSWMKHSGLENQADMNLIPNDIELPHLARLFR